MKPPATKPDSPAAGRAPSIPRPLRTPSHTALAALPVLALDLETTGLDVANDRIVQIGAVAMHGRALRSAPRIDTHVDPGVAIPAGSTRIHGLTDARVAGAPRFAELVEPLREALGRRVVVGPAHPVRSRGPAPRSGARRRALERPARPRRHAPRRSTGSGARRPRARSARGAVRRLRRGAPRCARRRPHRGRYLRRPDPETARGGRTDPRRSRSVRRPLHRARPPRGRGRLAPNVGGRPRSAPALRARPYRQLPLPASARRGDGRPRAGDPAGRHASPGRPHDDRASDRRAARGRGRSAADRDRDRARPPPGGHGPAHRPGRDDGVVGDERPGPEDAGRGDALSSPGAHGSARGAASLRRRRFRGSRRHGLAARPPAPSGERGRRARRRGSVRRRRGRVGGCARPAHRRRRRPDGRRGGRRGRRPHRFQRAPGPDRTRRGDRRGRSGGRGIRPRAGALVRAGARFGRPRREPAVRRSGQRPGARRGGGGRRLVRGARHPARGPARRSGGAALPRRDHGVEPGVARQPAGVAGAGRRLAAARHAGRSPPRRRLLRPRARGRRPRARSRSAHGRRRGGARVASLPCLACRIRRREVGAGRPVREASHAGWAGRPQARRTASARRGRPHPRPPDRVPGALDPRAHRSRRRGGARVAGRRRGPDPDPWIAAHPDPPPATGGPVHGSAAERPGRGGAARTFGAAIARPATCGGSTAPSGCCAPRSRGRRPALPSGPRGARRSPHARSPRRPVRASVRSPAALPTPDAPGPGAPRRRAPRAGPSLPRRCGRRSGRCWPRAPRPPVRGGSRRPGGRGRRPLPRR